MSNRTEICSSAPVLQLHCVFDCLAAITRRVQSRFHYATASRDTLLTRLNGDYAYCLEEPSDSEVYRKLTAAKGLQGEKERSDGVCQQLESGSSLKILTWKLDQVKLRVGMSSTCKIRYREHG
ncbi:hypothetical protein KIN20_034524 [Parelaphostrongylus tenuis]|uniref:Uncharacterized protein n=1 Tax=Parelaphostrongylus tenuis TaxID=148309 RepID=A0AAD5WJT0_PARTN|nr:hypothetical protein KIN20_034524 [Parelaphostrongylus tenuis]